MQPGFYVARRCNGGVRLILESRCFDKTKGPDVEWVRHKADSWRDWVASQHPKDDVFVVDVLEKKD